MARSCIRPYIIMAYLNLRCIAKLVGFDFVLASAAVAFSLFMNQSPQLGINNAAIQIMVLVLILTVKYQIVRNNCAELPFYLKLPFNPRMVVVCYHTVTLSSYGVPWLIGALLASAINGRIPNHLVYLAGLFLFLSPTIASMAIFLRVHFAAIPAYLASLTIVTAVIDWVIGRPNLPVTIGVLVVANYAISFWSTRFVRPRVD